MPDRDAFGSAYGRLVFTDLVGISRSARNDGPPLADAASRLAHENPASRLLGRLALVAPKAKARRRGKGDSPPRDT